jgi:hypothetical protein
LSNPASKFRTFGEVMNKHTLPLGLALLLFGCGGNADQAKDPNQVVAAEEAPRPVASAAAGRLTTQQQVDMCKVEIAEHLGVEADAVTLSGATPVTWRSGALGCPEPGMNYTQALVPGVWIMMRSGDGVYRCHATQTGAPFYCPDERAENPAVGAAAD